LLPHSPRPFIWRLEHPMIHAIWENDMLGETLHRLSEFLGSIWHRFVPSFENYLMRSRLLNVLVVSLSTVGSRVLGLLRDILVFSIFGSSALNSAFLLAFTFPNLFRRLLGEGALTAAMLPLLTEEKEKFGESRLFWLYNKILSRLVTVLFALVAIFSLILIAVGQIPGLQERWNLTMILGVLLFPYMALVCVAAAFAAALNAMHRYVVPALTSVWLNFSILLLLGGLGYFATEVSLYRMYWLCTGVLVGGFFQVLIPWVALRREGWEFELDFKPTSKLKEFSRLLLPGILGASVIQVNLLISRTLAHVLDESAVSIYYLANRLVELPLGVFSIAIATVYFPLLSECATRGDQRNFSATFQQALRLMFAITIPATVGLIILGEPILRLLFEWGAFRAGDTQLTLPILWAFAFGLPVYSMVALLLRGFYAHKDTKTPMKVATFSFVLNAVLSLALMWPLGVFGLALANVLSFFGQAILLTALLSNYLQRNLVSDIAFDLVKILIGSAVMIGVIYLLRWWIVYLPFTEKGEAAIIVLVVIPASVVIYFLVLWIAKFRDMEELRGLVVRPVSQGLSGE